MHSIRVISSFFTLHPLHLTLISQWGTPVDQTGRPICKGKDSGRSHRFLNRSEKGVGITQKDRLGNEAWKEGTGNGQ